MAASIQFRIGNRCYFYIDGKRMNGEIAALSVESGIHLVSLEPQPSGSNDSCAYLQVRVFNSQKERWVAHT